MKKFILADVLGIEEINDEEETNNPYEPDPSDPCIATVCGATFVGAMLFIIAGMLGFTPLGKTDDVSIIKYMFLMGIGLIGFFFSLAMYAMWTIESRQKEIYSMVKSLANPKHNLQSVLEKDPSTLEKNNLI